MIKQIFAINKLMNSLRNIVILIILMSCLFSSNYIGFAQNTSLSEKTSKLKGLEGRNTDNPKLTYVPHDPIFITSNTDFGSYGFPGSGTTEDPYIIENYNITTTDTLIGGIYLEYASRYIIRNCWISAPNSYAGIYAQANSRAVIMNNTFINNEKGILLWDTYYMSLIGNSFTSNNFGVEIYDSQYIRVLNNTCGINNQDGIIMEDSDQFHFENNTFSNNYNGLVITNSDSGILQRNTFKNNEYAGLHLLLSEATIISENACSNNSVGIVLERADYSYVINNNFTKNNNELSHVINQGIHLKNTIETTIKSNDFFKNNHYSVYMDNNSSDNRIHHNNFLYNNQNLTQVFDDGTSNIWFDNSISEGNHYSDWISGSYLVDGLTGSIDEFPLSSPISHSIVSLFPILPDSSIYISSDEELTVFPGTGTEEDPYIIEGYNISTNRIYGLSISGVSKSYAIRNCLVKARDYGIATDGETGSIINNTCTNNGLYGIYNRIDHSIVANNTCSFNQVGIVASGSADSIVINNTCSNNTNYGIQAQSFITVNNNTCVFNNAGIFLVQSVQTLVVNNTCIYNFYGILINGGFKVTLENNTCNSNFYGIRLSSYSQIISRSCNLTSNICSFNEYGLNLVATDTTSITNNLFFENMMTGISLNYNSDSNNIFHNKFIDNNLSGTSAQAIDDGSNNLWGDFTIKEGNRWSDWSGDFPYLISGSAMVYDYFPLDEEGIPYNDGVNPTIDNPADFSIVFGEDAQPIVWYTSDEWPDYYVIKINGTEVAIYPWTGGNILYYLNNLPVGESDLECVVYDIYGNWASDSVNVKVKEQGTETEKTNYSVLFLIALFPLIVTLTYLLKKKEVALDHIK